LQEYDYLGRRPPADWREREIISFVGDGPFRRVMSPNYDPACKHGPYSHGFHRRGAAKLYASTFRPSERDLIVRQEYDLIPDERKFALTRDGGSSNDHCKMSKPPR
jgi:hypothetical protein